ncbi:MAG: phosphotransferase [Phycisphaerales bacterium]
MGDSTFNAALASLLGQPVVSVTKIGRGRNSKVVRVHCADGGSYAAKLYHGRRADGLSRLAVEFESLELLWNHGFRCVPRPLASDAEKQIAVYEYIDGQEVDGRAIGEGEIDELLAFIGRLKDLARTIDYKCVPAAHEACFSAAAVVENINRKLADLIALGGAGPSRDALQAFLESEFKPALRDCVARAMARAGEDAFGAELPVEWRTLSPADFGFHNALRRDGTGLVFLDFEYFGWEEPVKMMCDFLLHPAVSLRQEIRQYFAWRFPERFAEDEGLEARFRTAYPLYGLRWCMILLNEFLPRHLERRTYASTQDADVSQLHIRQLAKARQMLHRTIAEHDCWPYAASGMGIA